jgi:SAM-dependent methyltransferase
MRSTEPEAGVRPTYTAEQFAPLFAVEDRHFWFRSRNRCIAAALRANCDLGAVRSVLEVGCGTGVVLAELQRLFPAGDVVGLDLFEEGLAYARRRFSGTLVQGDIFQYSPERQFDLVCAFDVIEHVDADVTMLRRLARLVRPGGHVIVTVPAHQSLWSYFDVVARHRRRYDAASLVYKLESAGFHSLYITQFMAALFPVMWMKRRWFGRGVSSGSTADARQQQAAAESDLDVNPLINWVLNLLMRLDEFFIARRLRVPMGTSIIAVAARRESESDPEANG